MTNSKKPVCAVIGIGPGNGEALARRFAADGYRVALLSRKTDRSAELAKELDGKAIACDAGDPASVARAFAAIRSELGEVDVVVYNAGSGTWGTIEDISLTDFENAWRVNALGLLAVSKEVVPSMKAKGAGAIVVIGATASRRGGIKTASFAPAKAAQKSLCESMARHLGPVGIHVSLIVVDGVVDLPRTREQMKDKPNDFFLRPAAIADLASFLVRQDRSAWSFEVEARPFGEKW